MTGFPLPASRLRSALGDPAALNACAIDLLSAAKAGDVPSSVAHPQAEALARLAASSGSHSALFGLVWVLGARVDDALASGDIRLVDELSGEGLSILATVADEGNEDAALWFNAAADAASPAALAIAKGRAAPRLNFGAMMAEYYFGGVAEGGQE